jgi:hypothetical protein
VTAKQCFLADKCIYLISLDDMAPCSFSLWQRLELASVLRYALACGMNGEL